MTKEFREVLLQNWDYCMEKEDWYPPMSDALKDLTAEQAVWKPSEGPANSIWENVQHLLFYKKRLLARIRETAEVQEGVTNDDTFRVPDAGEEAWRTTVEEYAKVHAELRRELEHMPKQELTEDPQRVVSLITHDAYHIGQIILLRKLQGSWPATRSFS